MLCNHCLSPNITVRQWGNYIDAKCNDCGNRIHLNNEEIIEVKQKFNSKEYIC